MTRSVRCIVPGEASVRRYLRTGRDMPDGLLARPLQNRPGDACSGARDDEPVQILLTADATIEQIDSRGAMALVERYPVLAKFGRAFMATELDDARVSWISPEGEWYAIRLEARSGDRTLLTATRRTPPFGLTPRESDVLTLVAGGLSNADIAARLNSSPRTISTHLERILVKTDQSNRAGAASLAVDLGLLRLPVPGGGRSLAGLAVGKIDAALSGNRPPLRDAARRSLRQRPITVGAAMALSGFSSADGLEMLKGTQLAVAELNERGGINGRAVDLMTVDTDILDPESVRQSFQTLADAEVDAITSGYSAAQSIATEIAAEYGCPYLNAATLESMIVRVRENQRRYGRTFHVCPSDRYYSSGFVRFLNDLVATGAWTPRNRRLGVLEIRWPDIDIGLPAMLDEAARTKWTVDFVEPIGIRDVNWDSVMRRITHAEPAAVLVAHYFPSVTAELQRRFLREPTDTLMYTTYGPSIPEYVDSLESAAEGVLWSTVTGVYGDLPGQRFARRYRQYHGVAPGRSHAGIGYDRVRILGDAWARAGNPRAFDRVADEIRRGVHRGVNGSYFLDNPGQAGLAYPDATPDPSIGQAHLVFQIQHGRHRTLSPSPYADGVFRLPPWFRHR